jgi:hypothetical protein
LEEENDRWKWGESDYIVKDAYRILTYKEHEENGLYAEVWNPLVP